MVLYMAVVTAFWVLEAEKKRKKDAAGRRGGGVMAGSWSQGEGWRERRRGGRRDGLRRCRRGAGGYGGGGWCSDNQSISLHRFRGGEGRRVGLFLHRCKFAPAAAVDHGRRR